MKKVILILGLSLVLMAGCASIQLDYEIDENYTASVHYAVELAVDKDEIFALRNSFEGLIRSFAKTYENKGFVAEYALEDGLYQLDLRLTKEHDSYDEAYQSLKGLMSDPEISFLLELDFNALAEKDEHAFILEAMTDIPLILDTLGIPDAPKIVRDEIYSELNNSEIILNIILPHSTVISKSDNVEVTHKDKKTIYTVPVEKDAETRIKIDSRLSFIQDKLSTADSETTLKKIENQLTLYRILLYGGIMLATGCVVYAGFQILNKKKDI